MRIDFFPGETTLGSFKLVDGSGWITSHRLIICIHKPGQLDSAVPEFYFLKDFKRSQIRGSTLFAYFDGKPEVKIQLQTDSPSVLQEIQEYIEKASRRIK